MAKPPLISPALPHKGSHAPTANPASSSNQEFNKKSLSPLPQKKYPIFFIGIVICSVALLGMFSIPTSGTTLNHILKNSLAPFFFNNSNYGAVSIGIYTGRSPFDLQQPEDISNPVLTWKDVTDIDAAYVADPFMLIEKERYYMFFEVKNRNTKSKDIGYAESLDGKKWEYKKIVIDEPFQLSYPYVFKWDNSYYLMPESNTDLSVRLYKAVSFPDKWEYVGNLINGDHWVDPSLVRYKDKWWLFVSTVDQDHLDLYYSDDLLGHWTPHPQNPLVKHNQHISRPGGRVFSYNNHLYRLAQDDYPRYGIQVFAADITELSETSYQETMVEKPVVTMSGSGWNAVGMHTVDPHFVKDTWIAAVDGILK